MIDKLIVSVTSHPPRFASLPQVMRRLLSQDVKPAAVVLWLAPDEIAELPAAVLNMDGVTVRVCANIRSYKKLVPALHAYPDAHILTADDDLLYPLSWVRSFVEAYRGEREILLRRGRRMVTDADGVLIAYEEWPAMAHAHTSGRIFPTSCYGMLVPPGAMPVEALDMGEAQRLAPTNDDFWWYWMGLKGGCRFRIIGGDRIEALPCSKNGLLQQYNRGAGNARQLAAMIRAYGMPE